jgi:septal ring factor EnvC (AmiA/AmiB activator)
VNVHINSVTIFKFPSNRLDELEASLEEITQKIDTLDMKVSELVPSLNALGDKLDQAKAELVALIDQLRQSDPDLSPEGAAALARISQITDALDALTPEPPPVEQPPPVEPPPEEQPAGFRGSHKSHK